MKSLIPHIRVLSFLYFFVKFYFIIIIILRFIIVKKVFEYCMKSKKSLYIHSEIKYLMKRVKIALITAAGLGSRMFPYTKNMNKLMIPILNKPMIHYLVDELVKSGIEEIIISGRYLEPVKKYLQNNPKRIEETKEFGQKGSLRNLKTADFKCKFVFVEQEKPKGWMYEVYRSRKRFGNKPFAVVMSDILFYCKKPAISQIIKKYYETGLNVHGICRYVFTPNLLKILEKISFEQGDDSHAVTLAFKEMSDKGKLLSLSIEGTWFDIGTPIGKLKAESYSALRDKKISEEYKEYLKEVLSKDLE